VDDRSDTSPIWRFLEGGFSPAPADPGDKRIDLKELRLSELGADEHERRLRLLDGQTLSATNHRLRDCALLSNQYYRLSFSSGSSESAQHITRNYRHLPWPPGFKRDDLRNRYDVSTIKEDDWHSYSGRKTSEFLTEQLALLGPSAKRLLNAGGGVYGNTTGQSDEVSVDLFSTPTKGRKNAVCASVEMLPFSDDSFSCVG
jgi:hypothetical protein